MPCSNDCYCTGDEHDDTVDRQYIGVHAGQDMSKLESYFYDAFKSLGMFDDYARSEAKIAHDAFKQYLTDKNMTLVTDHALRELLKVQKERDQLRELLSLSDASSERLAGEYEAKREALVMIRELCDEAL